MEAFLSSLPEWNDDQRLRALYASFPDKTVNKTAYESRMAIWKRILISSISNQWLSDSKCCLHRRDLEAKFKRKGTTPLGLQTVIDDMVESGLLVDVTLFKQDKSWNMWLLDALVHAPVNWAWQQMFGSQQSAQNDKVYVLVSAVQDIANTLSESIYNGSHSSIDLIFTLQDLKLQYATNTLLSDVLLVCRQLASESKILIQLGAEAESSIIKFKPPRSNLTPINETDKGIVTIKTTLSHLNKQVSRLDERSAQLMDQTKQHIKNKDRIRAKFVLKQRKMVEDVLEKRLASLATLEAIIDKLQAAETDAELISVYQIGTRTLQEFVSHTGLTVAKVDATMDALDDVLADQREVEDAMMTGNAMVQPNISEDELEQELDSILAEQAKPAVPVAAVNVVTEGTQKVDGSVNDELLRELDELTVPTIHDKTTAKSSHRQELVPSS
ncbi:hypothetical protein SmJEL517_g03371 [Synchytrium microbalum]|uniref:Charged multivesicular body protein 7 n=1 Tax=Synchytrium microbalum TaxID=1806994 RepID=A0A507C729_9FUNG|nr:uncharacterized protein SmJEL517_g03371 [Synchytrium microbalum]TPX33864.1 hypothetical protein SmJEL517_g03371 [Synchytrium microbalum]